jgi:hemoglobin-like flavoprotein
MIEHFSKWLELVPLLDCNNEGIAYAFFDKMFGKFGALAEVLINQGMEFQGDFQDLCEKALIDHRTTSRDHPKSDRLAE